MGLPVDKGCAAPLKYPLVTAEKVHSRKGLEGVELFEPKIKAQKQHALDFIVEALMKAKDNSITLIPTGPLTNIAAALQKEPAIADKIYINTLRNLQK